VATPDGSDNEDSGDYDNVLGYLPAYEGRPKTPLRSGSFADLQKLRMTASDGLFDKNRSDCFSHHFPGGSAHKSVEVNHSPIDGEGLFLRRHRSRKPSLSDSVPVERISASDDDKEFRNVTNDINREIQEKKKGYRD
jgi:glycerol-3-phosphate O-acyltransferase/dihydroxyacetone phosphate acyltransferase